MPLNKSTLFRLRTIDSCLCRRYRKWTLEDLRQACEHALYDYEGISYISTRTIQRDIELMRSDKMGYNAPIVVKERKYYSYEDPEYSITDLPLTKHDIQELKSAMDIIKQFQGFKGMAGSEDILTRLQDRIEQQDSQGQTVFIETNTQLKGLNLLGDLYDHIIRCEPILLTYHSFKSDHDRKLLLSPFILKEFNNRWFLLGYEHNKNDIMTLVLDRMVAVKKDENEEYVENTFFNPQKYFREMVGVTRELNSTPEIVTVKVDADQAPYVLTKPLHSSQQMIKEDKDGSIVLSLNVILNLELERLLMGFGEHLEVIAPRSLRNKIARKILQTATLYQQI